MNAPSQIDATILFAALEYAGRGWGIFPARIKDGSKCSHVAGKANGGARWGATTDPATIRDYWHRWPEALLGIATGPESGLFVIDIDTAAAHGVDGVGNLAALIDQHGALPHTIEADTPSGGRHIYFKMPADLEIRNSASRLAPGIDARGQGGMVVAPPSRKPGAAMSYRWKNPPGLFELADCPDWLLDKIRATQEPKLSERASPTGFQIDTGATTWADTALREELARLLAAPEGQRNAALNGCAFNLGQIVAGGGLAEDIVKTRLSAAAAGIGLEPGETAATIESGFQAGAQTPRGPKERATTGIPAPAPDHQPEPAPLRSSVFFCAADLEGQPIPARQWLVDGLIPRGTVSLLGGDGGTGKSLVALQLAVATATGGAWLGLPVTAGRAIYISAEDDHDELHRRLADIVRAEGVTLADLDNLTVRSLAGEDALLAALDRAGGGLLASALFHEVDRRIGGESPALVVLDTLADLFPGNENDRAQARQFIGLLRGLAIRHECAVMMLAHPSLSGLNSGSGTSGSTGWNNSVRSRLYLSRVIQDGYLTESQRASVAARVANMIVGRPENKAANLPDLPELSLSQRAVAQAPISQADAAKMLNVSERSVATALRGGNRHRGRTSAPERPKPGPATPTSKKPPCPPAGLHGRTDRALNCALAHSRGFPY